MGSHCSKPKKKMSNQLFLFDFDQTIIMKDCETIYKSLVASRRKVPEDEKSLNHEFNWGEHVGQPLIDYTIRQGVHVDTILQAVRDLKFVPGMDSFLQAVSKSMKANAGHGSKLVVLSGVNDLFIETKLTSMSPPVHATEIISNHATITSDRHHINYDPLPRVRPIHGCPFCTRTVLCRGDALEDYIQQHGPFATVHFFCDGLSDVCPCLRLTDADIIYVRAGYELNSVIKSGDCGGYTIVIAAKIQYWSTGFDLIELAKNYL